MTRGSPALTHFHFVGGWEGQNKKKAKREKISICSEPQMKTTTNDERKDDEISGQDNYRLIGIRVDLADF